MKQKSRIKTIECKNIPANTGFIKSLTKGGAIKGTLYVDIVRKGIRKFQAETLLSKNGEILREEVRKKASIGDFVRV